MAIASLLHLVVLAPTVGLPGWLLYKAWLWRLGLSWRVGIGIVLAVLSVLFSDLAALLGYSFPLMLTTWAVVVLSIGIWWLFSRRASAENTHKNGKASLNSALLHLFLVGIFIAPAFVLYLPLDTDAQGFGYLALMVREGGTIDTLAPWHPEVRYLYSPALFVWWAFFSDLLGLPMHQVMLPFTHIIAGMTALLCIDLGATLMPDSPRARWLLPLMLVAGFGYFTTLMDSAYTSVMGFFFVALFLTLVFQNLRNSSRAVIALAAVALAAVALTHPDTILILLLGYIPFYTTFWLSRDEHRNLTTWLRWFLIIPISGIALTLPWLIRVFPLFFESGLVSPFMLDPAHVKQLTLYHGLVVPLVALGGLALAVYRRRLVDMLMIAWLLFIIDFSMFGLVDRAISPTGLDVMRYIYPFSVAWHGPILIYPYLATLILDHLLGQYPQGTAPRVSTFLLGSGLTLLALIVILQQPILQLSRGYANFFGTFSSRDDLAAMAYLRENTPEDALILNYPSGFEGHWVPVIAERQSVAFRDQPFFSGAEPYYERRDKLAKVYFDLAQDNAHELLLIWGVTHIIVPQIVIRPERFGDMSEMIRWRWPEETWYPLNSSPAEIDWLELVFDQDGAQVYRVLPLEP